VIQFAANTPIELHNAAEKVKPYCDAIDINCGCPKKWVMQEGYGSALLTNPELISQMVKITTNNINIPVSIKIRIDKDLTKTVALAQQAERAGVAWISVHGRTYKERSSQLANWNAIKLIKESVQIPVMANGDIFSLEDACKAYEQTKVNGVLSARGILANPALFYGYNTVPTECVMDYMNIAINNGTIFKTIHQHLMMMLFNTHTKWEKIEFNSIQSTTGLIDYFT